MPPPPGYAVTLCDSSLRTDTGVSAYRLLRARPTCTSAFTLIELSIVLVIIGLIVGGVLVGQNLIKAAEVRATVTQLEKFNTAANTFYGKYGYLPGDIKDPDATNFGFAARGGGVGQGNGNGLLQGGADGYGFENGSGETAMFWVDLSKARLIEGSFNTANSTTLPGTDITGSSLNLYFPSAKLGNGNYIYVWSGANVSNPNNYPVGAKNYFGIAGIQDITSANGYFLNTTKNMSVAQAYAIDKKMDDGLPTSGRVIAVHIYVDPVWMENGSDLLTSPIPSQTLGSSSSCFDNGGISGATEQYSMTQINGNGVNCSLSFEFQ